LTGFPSFSAASFSANFTTSGGASSSDFALGFTTPSFSPRLFGEILNERKPMILFLPVTFPAHTESSRLRGPRCGQLKQRIRFFSRQEIFNVLVLFTHDFSSPSTRQ
jgi:hypothetical protein